MRWSGRNAIGGGVLMGGALFLLFRHEFMSLLAALGYVDGRPGSTLVSWIFLTCMFVMCAGYGVGISVWLGRRINRTKSE